MERKNKNNNSTKALRNKNSQLVTRAQVRTMLNSKLDDRIEDKYFIVTQASTNIDYSGVTTVLSNPAQGTTDLTRIGDAIRLKHITIRVGLAVGDAYNFVRVIVFKWIPYTIPIPTSILFNTGTAQAPLGALTHDFQPQYKILSDSCITLTTNDSAKQFIISIPLKHTCSFYNGGTTPQSGIYIILISDSGAATHPTAQFVSKLDFEDA